MPNYLTVALAVVVLVTGYGWKVEHDRLTDFKAGVIAAGEAQNEKTREVIKRHEKAALDAQNDYSRRIADVRAYYRMFYGSGGGKLPPIANSSSGFDGAASYHVLAGQCAETTQQLVSLQAWVASVSSD